MAVKALACELPSRLDVSFASSACARHRHRGHDPGATAADISGTTIWRWLSEDAIRPWRSRSSLEPSETPTGKEAIRTLNAGGVGHLNPNVGLLIRGPSRSLPPQLPNSA